MEQVTREAIDAEVGAIQDEAALLAYIRKMSADLKAIEPNMPAFTAEIARISTGLDKVDANLTVVRKEIGEMWSETPPKEDSQGAGQSPDAKSATT